jgi:hypothetical protein
MAGEMVGNRAHTVHWSPAFKFHTQVQLLFARVPVQTLTEHNLNRECRRPPSQKQRTSGDAGPWLRSTIFSYNRGPAHGVRSIRINETATIRPDEPQLQEATSLEFQRPSL